MGQEALNHFIKESVVESAKGDADISAAIKDEEPLQYAAAHYKGGCACAGRGGAHCKGGCTCAGGVGHTTRVGARVLGGRGGEAHYMGGCTWVGGAAVRGGTLQGWVRVCLGGGGGRHTTRGGSFAGGGGVGGGPGVHTTRGYNAAWLYPGRMLLYCQGCG